MFASLFTMLNSLGYLISSPFVLLMFAFQVWMFVHAVRQEEWLWAVLIFFGWTFAAVLYYFFVYRATPSATRGFELPGAAKRDRIKELQAKIHHLDKAHHHSQLGDVYFQQGKLDLAETSYRAALERDPQDIDTRAHLGQCLLRARRPEEARPLLEGVVKENPRHDYGHSLMALAETMTALGDLDSALRLWKQVTESNSYARAKVQLAELYLARNQPDMARPELQEVVNDDAHAPAYERKRAGIWVRRARKLLKDL